MADADGLPALPGLLEELEEAAADPAPVLVGVEEDVPLGGRHAHPPGLRTGYGSCGRPAVDEEQPFVLDGGQQGAHRIPVGREPGTRMVVHALRVRDPRPAGLERAADLVGRHGGRERAVAAALGLVAVEGFQGDMKEDLEPVLVGDAGRVRGPGAVGKDRDGQGLTQAEEDIEGLEAVAHVVDDEGHPARAGLLGRHPGGLGRRRQQERDAGGLPVGPPDAPIDLRPVPAGRPLPVDHAHGRGGQGPLEGRFHRLVPFGRDLDLGDALPLRPCRPQHGIFGDPGGAQAIRQDLGQGLAGRGGLFDVRPPGEDEGRLALPRADEIQKKHGDEGDARENDGQQEEIRPGFGALEKRPPHRPSLRRE